MAHRLCTETSGAQFAVVFNVGLKSWPVVLHTYGMKSLSGQSVLQGDGNVSTEDGVINSQFVGHICVQNIEVNCQD